MDDEAMKKFDAAVEATWKPGEKKAHMEAVMADDKDSKQEPAWTGSHEAGLHALIELASKPAPKREPLTVMQLVLALQKFGPNAHVFISHSESGMHSPMEADDVFLACPSEDGLPDGSVIIDG